jgi:hypothetical protein
MLMRPILAQLGYLCKKNLLPIHFVCTIADYTYPVFSNIVFYAIDHFFHVPFNKAWAALKHTLLALVIHKYILEQCISIFT